MKLEEYMRRQELKDAEFAELIGIDRSSVCRLRAGDTKPNWATAQRIFDATGGAVTPNDFLDGLGESDETAA